MNTGSWNLERRPLSDRVSDLFREVGSRVLEACECVMSVPKPVKYVGAIAITAASLFLNLGGSRDVIASAFKDTPAVEQDSQCRVGGQNVGPENPETGC